MDAPGSAQIGPDFGRFTADSAVGEHVSEGLVLGRGSRSDVTVPQAMDVTALEEARSCAKNEIHMARDIAILKILTAAIRQNRILPAPKPAVPECRPVAV